MARETNKQTAGTAEAKTGSRYTREQILASARFASRADILGVLLTDGKEYTIAEVNSIMDGWMKKGVK